MPNNEYMRTYMLDRYYKRRALAIEKLGGRCVVCGTTERLEIDHIDYKTKTLNLAKLWSCAIEKFRKELEKCQLLCKTHHKEKSDKEQSVEHGGGLTGKRGCYCELCKPLKKAYYKTWRKGTVS